MTFCGGPAPLPGFPALPVDAATLEACETWLRSHVRDGALCVSPEKWEQKAPSQRSKKVITVVMKNVNAELLTAAIAAMILKCRVMPRGVVTLGDAAVRKRSRHRRRGRRANEDDESSPTRTVLLFLPRDFYETRRTYPPTGKIDIGFHSTKGRFDAHVDRTAGTYWNAVTLGWLALPPTTQLPTLLASVQLSVVEQCLAAGRTSAAFESAVLLRRDERFTSFGGGGDGSFGEKPLIRVLVHVEDPDDLDFLRQAIQNVRFEDAHLKCLDYEAARREVRQREVRQREARQREARRREARQHSKKKRAASLRDDREQARLEERTRQTFFALGSESKDLTYVDDTLVNNLHRVNVNLARRNLPLAISLNVSHGRTQEGDEKFGFVTFKTTEDRAAVHAAGAVVALFGDAALRQKEGTLLRAVEVREPGWDIPGPTDEELAVKRLAEIMDPTDVTPVSREEPPAAAAAESGGGPPVSLAETPPPEEAAPTFAALELQLQQITERLELLEAENARLLRAPAALGLPSSGDDDTHVGG